MQPVSSKAENKDPWENLYALRYPGFTLKKYEVKGDQLFLDLVATDYPICPQCHRKCTQFQLGRTRVVQDLPLFSGMEQYVRFKNRKVQCECGCRKNEEISWVKPRARITNELKALLKKLWL